MTAAKEKLVIVRLPRDRQAAAKAAAAERGVTIPNLFIDLLRGYAEGPKPTPVPRAVPQSERAQTRFSLPARVKQEVDSRASAEGRSVSAVLAELIEQL